MWHAATWIWLSCGGAQCRGILSGRAPPGLDGPRSRSPQGAGRGPTHQTGDAFPAVDCYAPGVYRLADIADVLLFSDIGLLLVHHYRVHKRGLPHVAFCRNYMFCHVVVYRAAVKRYSPTVRRSGAD